MGSDSNQKCTCSRLLPFRVTTSKASGVLPKYCAIWPFADTVHTVLIGSVVLNVIFYAVDVNSER